MLAITDDNFNKMFTMVKQAMQKPDNGAGKSFNFVIEYAKGGENHLSHPKVTKPQE